MSQWKRAGIFLVVFLAFCLIVLKVAGPGEPQTGGIDLTGDTEGELLELWGIDEVLAGSGVSGEEKIKALEGLGYILTEEEKETARTADGVGYADLLADFGWGEYDYDNLTWSPTSDWVYALDTEIFQVDKMYPDFFAGLLSISGGEVPITDVVQDDSKVDWEEGTGTWIITLNYDGKPYTIKAQAQSDWLDCSVLKSINSILEKEGHSHRYYAMWNSYQGITVLFLDRDQARDFERATGCKLHTSL